MALVLKRNRFINWFADDFGMAASAQSGTGMMASAQEFNSVEEMMAAHHGGATAQQSTDQSMQSHHGSSGGMVGGC